MASPARSWSGAPSHSAGLPASARSWPASWGWPRYANPRVQGAALLTIYSAGLAVPFLVAGWSIEYFFQAFQKIKHHFRKLEVASGIILVGVGILLVTDRLSWLNSPLPVHGRVDLGRRAGAAMRAIAQAGACVGAALALAWLGCGADEPRRAAARRRPSRGRGAAAPDFTLPDSAGQADPPVRFPRQGGHHRLLGHLVPALRLPGSRAQQARGRPPGEGRRRGDRRLRGRGWPGGRGALGGGACRRVHDRVRRRGARRGVRGVRFPEPGDHRPRGRASLHVTWA